MITTLNRFGGRVSDRLQKRLSPTTERPYTAVERMPDLPFLGLIRNRKHRHRAVTEAIRAAGIDINTLTPPHLVKRYGMRQDEASKIVQVAQGVMP